MVTVRQLRERMLELPPELNDEEVVATGKVGDGPNWMYEIGLPHWHNGPAVCMPIKRLTRPITQAMIDALEPENRLLLERMVSSGEWPFEERAS